MAWYNLVLTGEIFDATEVRQSSLLAGDRSLEFLLMRLRDHLQCKMEGCRGQFANGLLAAAAVQLAIGQWESWAAFRAFEQGEGRLYPPVTEFLKRAPRSGSSSPGSSGPQDSPASPPTS